MWFDNYLLSKGDAYKNFQGTDFYNYSDEQITNKTVFGSPYKQWVYDKSISSAKAVPSISGEGGALSAGESGMIIDYENGRVLFDSTVSTSANISGGYAVKNFNTYVSNQNEESLIIEGKYKLNARYTRDLTYVQPYEEVVPAVFLSTTTTTNEPFAFGGTDNTITNISAVAFAENTYQLDGILSIFADSSKEVFRNIPYTGAPLDEFGDIKSSYSTGYDYNNVSNNYKTDICFIQNSTVSKISDRMDKFIPIPLYVGFMDFEINKYRDPRQ
jgi:hypothetical protein|tara:strand:- start:758 stop:1573 length:816 start_codon:yes stop_codon:yes gene_type:complete